ncbi:MAG: hypothetical protein ABI644_03480 [Arenimonas sp.]
MNFLIRTGFQLLGLACLFAAFYGLLLFVNELRGSASPVKLISFGLLMPAGILAVIACNKKAKQITMDHENQLSASVLRSHRFEANIKHWKILLLMMILLPILLLFPYIVLMSKSVSIGSILLALFCLLLAAGMLNLLLSYFRSGKSTLVIDNTGVDFVWFGRIPWDQIQGIFLQEIRTRYSKQYLLMLYVTKPCRYMDGLPLMRKIFITKKYRNAVTGAVGIPLNLFDQPANVIHKAALHFQGKTNLPLISLWNPLMSSERIAFQRESDATLAKMVEITSAMNKGSQVTPQVEEEMMQLINQQSSLMEAQQPLLRSEMKKARRLIYLSYALSFIAIICVVLRIVMR